MKKLNILSIFLVLLVACGSEDQIKENPNVLFICVDDLRAELGAYGNEYIVSPNIDGLASEGILFKNHFVNVPTCGASRYSLLTGMLPRRAGELGNDAIRKYISGEEERKRPESFIHHLKRNGYYTVGIGKIGHYVDGLLYGYTDSAGTERELPYSWDELHFDPGKWETGWNAFFGYADGSNRQSMNKKVKPYERGEVDDLGYPDGLSAELARKKLRELAEIDDPFFLGVGFFKPHLPFNSPAKYWDLYDREHIPLSKNPTIPEGISRASLHSSGEFNQYLLGEEKASLDIAVSDEYARKLRHAYYAGISYIDALIGSLIKELKDLGLYDNTIIVVWGDHGWHLGDHLVWGKHTIFEESLKSALIIKAPGSEHMKLESIASTIDIYPTLMDLCNVPLPFETDGLSFYALMNGNQDKMDNLAFSYYRNGISMRTDRYRISKYNREALPLVELYDHATDPLENKNIAKDNRSLRDSLLNMLEEEGDTGLFSKR